MQERGALAGVARSVSEAEGIVGQEKLDVIVKG